MWLIWVTRWAWWRDVHIQYITWDACILYNVCAKYARMKFFTLCVPEWRMDHGGMRAYVCGWVDTSFKHISYASVHVSTRMCKYACMYACMMYRIQRTTRTTISNTEWWWMFLKGTKACIQKSLQSPKLANGYNKKGRCVWICTALKKYICTAFLIRHAS